MQIHELEPNQEIKFIIEENTGETELHARVCEKLPEISKFTEILKQKTQIPFIFVDAAQNAKTILDAWQNKQNITIDATQNNTHFLFAPEDIKPITLPSGKACLLVFDIDNEEQNERRGGYRVTINTPGLLVSTREKEPVHVIIRDLSVTGIGVIANKDITCRINDQIGLSFTTDGVDQWVTAKVIRIADYDTKHYLIGCTLNPEELK